MEQVEFPLVTIATALFVTALEVERDLRGMEHCAERVSRLRAKLDQPGRVAEIDGASKILAAFCEACPFDGCIVKSWPFRITHSLPSQEMAGSRLSAQ